jgi:signal transduction histidine kinase
MSEEHLVRLMYHLLSYAVRYSPQRGRIAVGRIEGEFYVSDLGPGMSSDTRARAFTIFFTTMKKAKEHTGAGLFIARKIAGVYGGSMRIESSNDSGTSVLFTLGPQFPGT